MLKIGIDLDDCISYIPDFFQLMTHSMKDVAEIHVITDTTSVVIQHRSIDEKE